MKKLLLLMIVALLIFACAQTPTGQVTKEELKVGVITPLTGDLAIFGTEIQKGLELANEELNITLIYEDGCLPKESYDAAQRLENVHKVDMYNGMFCIVSFESLHASTEKPIMSAAVLIDQTKYGNQLTTTSFLAKDEAYFEAEYAFRQGKRKAAILHYTTPFGEEYETYFKKRFEELGGEVVIVETFDLFEKDFKSILLKVKAEKPDVILAIHFGQLLGIMLQQIDQLEIDALIIGNYESEDPVVIETAKDAAEGFVLSTVKQTIDPKFRKRFITKYGEEPSLLAMNGYDALKLQVTAFKKCSGDQDCMMNFYAQEHQGVYGNYTVNYTAKREFTLKQVIDGKFVILD